MDPILNSSTFSANPLRIADPVLISDAVNLPDLTAGFYFEDVRITGTSTSGTISESSDTDSLSEKFEAFIDELNKQIICKQVSLTFRIDRPSGSVIVKVIESESGKVIRQIPPDSILAMRRRLQEMTGVMLDNEI